MAEEFVTVARLRAQLAAVLARLGKREGPVYVLQHGQPRAVLLDVDEYRALMEQVEYLDDSLEAVLAQGRRARGEEGSRPLGDVMRDLRARPKKTAKPPKAAATPVRRPRAPAPR